MRYVIPLILTTDAAGNGVIVDLVRNSVVVPVVQISTNSLRRLLKKLCHPRQRDHGTLQIRIFAESVDTRLRFWTALFPFAIRTIQMDTAVAPWDYAAMNPNLAIVWILRKIRTCDLDRKRYWQNCGGCGKMVLRSRVFVVRVLQKLMAQGRSVTLKDRRRVVDLGDIVARRNITVRVVLHVKITEHFPKHSFEKCEFWTNKAKPISCLISFLETVEHGITKNGGKWNVAYAITYYKL